MPPQAERPASFEEIIQGLAKQSGVSPTLALAVAEQESGFNPAAKSPKGALGIMQLMPATAAEMGVDPMDPVQNIQGGLKYLKQLNDRYQGDVQKVLMAYNGGPTAVDAGTPIPETQAYATAVLSRVARRTNALSAQPAAAQPGAPAPPVKPVASHEPEKEPGLMRQLAAGVDPRERTGRKNLAGMVGAAAGGILAAPTAAIAGPAGPATGAVLGSMAGGALEELGEQGVEWLQGRRPGGLAPEEVGRSATEQGLYQAGGEVLMWPIIRVGKSLIASRVGRQANEALTRGVETATAGARESMRTVREGTTEATQIAANKAKETLQSSKDAVAQFLRDVRLQSAERVAATERAAAGGTKQAEQSAWAKLADAELEAGDIVAAARSRYDRLAVQGERVGAATDATRDVLAGLPGLHGGPEGPAKRALDAVGAKIEEVAKTGPMVKMGPLQALLQKMATKQRPEPFFQTKNSSALSQIGFSPQTGPTSAAAKTGLPSKGEQDKLLKMISDQLGIDESHPLPAVLGQIMAAPEEVTFAQAHQLKRLLDEAVVWDRTAKKHLEAMTKGIRTTLRQDLSVHAPYNEATSAYARLAKLYRSGAGSQITKAAADRPDRIASVLKAANPNDAIAVRTLLLDQAKAGGDEAAGQRAWDAVRSAYTYDHLIAGGPEKLGERVATLATEHPEFVREVFGDGSGKKVIENLRIIGDAFTGAQGTAKSTVQGAKTAGKDLIAASHQTGAEQVANARREAAEMLAASKTRGAKAVREQATAGVQEVESAKVRGKAAIDATREQARAEVGAAKGAKEAFQKSSMGRYATRPIESQGADILRGIGLGPKTIWGAVSLIRLLESPKGKDLIQAAAYSDRLTRGVVNILTGRAPGQVAAATIRELIALTSESKDAATNSASPQPAK